MLIIGNYRIAENIYQSNTSMVYRGKTIDSRKPVILKLLNVSQPTQDTLDRFSIEFEIQSLFNSDGIVRAYRFEEHNSKPMIVMEDFYGIPLSQTINANKLKIGWFLELAISLTDILDTIHEKKIIHKDITPSNILYNSTTGQIKVIDFSRAQYLTDSREIALEGSLPYLAPELTGRIKVDPDYRTDLYILGATFYHILTGALPFQTSDAMEMIHFHMAKEPTPAHKTHSSIPLPLSEIISRLMEKSSENRYQSCKGLREDLLKCLNGLRSGSPLVPFELGQKDSGSTFQIPDKLFGRDKELETLTTIFVPHNNRRYKALLITGEKGSGKTILAEELRSSFQTQNDYFITGTFFKETIFGPILGALQDYIRQLLTKDSKQIETWKKRLKKVLKDEGRVITDVLPEIENLIGSQPILQVLSPSETAARFNRVIKSFIKVCASKDSALVMFLDDIQLAAPPTISLIKSLLYDESIANIRFIFSLETSGKGQLLNPFDPPRSANPFIHIDLDSLSNHAVGEFVAQTLQTDVEAIKPLATVMAVKTDAIPLYLRLFFILIYHKGYLKKDLNSNSWTYDLDSIKRENCTENMVNNSIGNLHYLTEKHLEVIQTASCLNDPFKRDYLDIITGYPTAKHLTQLESMGFITMLEHGKMTQVHFSHPRIKNAVYMTLDNVERKKLHLKIGRLLLENIGSVEYSYEIADQLNSAIDIIAGAIEQMTLSEINYTAGTKALNRHDYVLAVNYLNHAYEFLPENSWQTDYEKTLEVHLKLCEAASRNSQCELTEQITEIVLEKATCVEAKTTACLHLLNALKKTNRLHESMEIGIKALSLLGISFPQKPTELQRISALMQIKAILGMKNIYTLAALPELKDSRMKLATRIMMEISPTAYSIKPEMLTFIGLKALKITLKYGNSRKAAAAGFALLGITLCSSPLGNLKKGIELGELAMDYHYSLKETDADIFTPFVYTNFLLHWSRHVKEGMDPLVALFNESDTRDNLDLRVSAANSISYRLILNGNNLHHVARDLVTYRQALEHAGQQILIYRQMIYQQLVENLLEGTDKQIEDFAGSFYNEKNLLHLHLEENDQTTLFQLNLIKLIQYYIFKQNEKGLKAASKAQQYLPGAMGSFFVPIYLFFDSLIKLAEYRRQKHVARNYFLKKVDENQKTLKSWAAHAPMNYLDKYTLVEAEKARILDKRHLALELYDQAISLAQKNGNLIVEAIANETLAGFYHDIDKPGLAKPYLQEAKTLYSKWGVTAKVKRIDAELQPSLPQENRGLQRSGPLSPIPLENRSRVDMMAVIKASRTLTSEIVLEELLKKMLRIMIENAGAQKGFLLFMENDAWMVRARGSVILVDTSIKLLSGSLDSFQNELSRAIIHYVARTEEIVVLNDATNQGLFVYDSYIRSKKPKSILCAPIIYQGQTACILYLENNLTTRAFPPERQEILNILGTQAAISLKNSSLYSDLGRTVDQLHNEIEKRKETQRQLMHAEKLGALGRLSASIAHEFGNPLMGIRYLLEDFHNRLKLQDEDQELLEIGLEECNRMKNLMNELHQLDRPSTGKMTSFDLHSSLDNLLTFQSKIFTSKNITVKKSFDQKIKNIIAVEDQITQVLINLLLNAADAITGAAGGTITITTRLENEWIIIIISDTGSGIDEKDMEKIFEPFFSTKPEVEGTGLGLPTSFGIITSHGGDISCSSSLTRGTTFTIKLPAPH